MKPNAWESFQNEFLALLKRDFKVTGLHEGTDITIMDSLAYAETMNLLEYELEVQVTFEELKKLKTFGDLTTLLHAKGFTGA